MVESDEMHMTNAELLRLIAHAHTKQHVTRGDVKQVRNALFELHDRGIINEVQARHMSTQFRFEGVI